MQTLHTVLRGKLLFYSKRSTNCILILLFFFLETNFFFKKSNFTYVFSEICIEQALTIHALLKKKMCPYQLLEAKKGLSSLGYRNVSYIFFKISFVILLLIKKLFKETK